MNAKAAGGAGLPRDWIPGHRHVVGAFGLCAVVAVLALVGAGEIVTIRVGTETAETAVMAPEGEEVPEPSSLGHPPLPVPWTPPWPMRARTVGMLGGLGLVVTSVSLLTGRRPLTVTARGVSAVVLCAVTLVFAPFVTGWSLRRRLG